jgi:hypothetical protein
VPYIFAGLPAASIESVKTYVMDMINFFKSFKVTILDLNTIYVFDDRLTNTCLIIDDAIIKCFFNPKEQVLPNKDRISSLSTTRIEVHRSEITDRWYKAYRQYHTGKSDCGIIKDTISRKASTRLSDSYTITDKVPQIAYVYDQSDIVGITKERARKKNTMHITESSGISNENVSIRYV